MRGKKEKKKAFFSSFFFSAAATAVSVSNHTRENFKIFPQACPPTLPPIILTYIANTLFFFSSASLGPLNQV